MPNLRALPRNPGNPSDPGFENPGYYELLDAQGGGQDESGLVAGDESNRQAPSEQHPGRTPPTPGNRPGKNPPVGREPFAGENGVGFLGGGSNTMSPPSVTQQQPFVSLSSPSTESLVFGNNPRGNLLGSSGGQFGGGLGLAGGMGGENSQEDPSSLLLALLQSIG